LRGRDPPPHGAQQSSPLLLVPGGHRRDPALGGRLRLLRRWRPPLPRPRHPDPAGQRGPALRLQPGLPRLPPRGRWRPRLLLVLPGRQGPVPALAVGHRLQRPPRRLGQHVQRGDRRGLHPPPPVRHARPPPAGEMSESYQTRECDVLVVGAGGAGLRAAIAAAEAGRSTLVVSKSLLGKAHTVMAEGGIAAGLANLDTPESWEVHFADTMLGGQLVNNWRMVDLYS